MRDIVEATVQLLVSPLQQKPMGFRATFLVFLPTTKSASDRNSHVVCYNSVSVFLLFEKGKKYLQHFSRPNGCDFCHLYTKFIIKTVLERRRRNFLRFYPCNWRFPLYFRSFEAKFDRNLVKILPF